MSDYEIEVEKLKKEIFQLKADKDFVWSLWKRLQLSSPDLTEAVNLISQREKEKMSDKHQQYEREIVEKDEKLQNLLKTVDSKNQEIENLVKSNNEILHKATQLEKHCVDVTEKALKLDKLIKTIEENGQREIIVSYERERQQLTESVSRLQAQITHLTEEKTRLQIINVENQENVKNHEDLQRFVVELREQLDDANVHINTQQETIEMLRGQLENRQKYVNDGDMRSDQTRGDQDNNQNLPYDHGCESPVSPIQDLNYKVDRLSLHMKHLQDCMATKPTNQFQKSSRSKSTPNRKNFQANTQHQNEMARKIEFLTNKLKKIENTLTIEQKNSSSATEFLDKANKRIKGMQLTIRQLRQQIEDSKEIEKESKRIIDQIDYEKELYKKELRCKELEIQRMKENSLSDASRINDLLSKLEQMRDDLTGKQIKQEQEANKEIETLRDLVKSLETEKCQMESKFIESLPICCNFQQQNCCHVIDKSQKHRFPVGRNMRFKTISSKDRIKRNSKTIKMSSILNHFVENVKDNKEEEWEDVETDEEEIPTDTTNSRTGRSSVPSTGTRIAKVAQINRCSSTQKDSSRIRNKEAEIEHISRMKESKEKSSTQEKDYNIAKSRIDSLQQQLKGVAASRDLYRNKCKTMQTEMKHLHSDFQQAKLRCTRLIEAIKKQSGLHQIMLQERRQYLGPTAEAGLPSDNLLKELASFDIDDQSGSIVPPSVTDFPSIYREIQQELIRKNSELLLARERLSKLERESSCKKKIIDDLRNKLISLESAKENERISLENKERKVKELEETNARMKIQTDSLQARFNVVLDERKRFEQESGNLRIKLEAADSKLGELKQSKQLMESRISNADENHEMRINDIVARSGSALEKASSQINALKARGGKYETLVLNLAKDFHQKIREIRRLIEFGNRRLSNSSTADRISRNEGKVTGKSEESSTGYDFARRKAADILQMSTTEIDSLFSGITATAGLHREAQQGNNSALEHSMEFTNRCRQALKTKSFDREVLSIFGEKLEELVDFIAPSSCDSGCVSSC